MQLSGQVLGLQAANRTAAATLDASLRSLKDQVVLSDDMFLNSGSAGVMGLVHSESFQQALDAAIEQRLQWQTSDELLDALRGLEAMLNGLAVNFPANTVR